MDLMIDNTIGVDKATDWDCTINDSFVALIRGMKGPTDFVDELELILNSRQRFIMHMDLMVDSTVGVDKVIDWDCTISNSPVPLVRAMKGSTDFVQEFENTARMTKATNWDYRVNNSLVALIRGMKGPKDFVQEFDEMSLIDPKSSHWSSEVRMVRSEQDMGSVTQFKESTTPVLLDNRPCDIGHYNYMDLVINNTIEVDKATNKNRYINDNWLCDCHPWDGRVHGKTSKKWG